MADLQSKMDAHQRDIDRAKEQIHEATQKTDTYLTELIKRVERYENDHADFQPAIKYMKSALDASRSATQKLETEGLHLSERSVPVAIDGMKAVRESLDDLQKQAIEYDNKYAGKRGQHAKDTLQYWVNAGRQSATDAMETTSEQLMNLGGAIENVAGQAAHGAKVALGEAVCAAEFGDEKLGVSNKAGRVVQKVRDLDARLGVTATVAKVDSKITGGLGCKVASTTVDMVTESVTYISETLHNAKLAAQQSSAARDVEAKAAAAIGAAAVKKNEAQEKVSSAVEQGKKMAGMTSEKAQTKTGEMKDTAAEKMEQAKDVTKEKTREAAEIAKQKADMDKDKAAETANQAKNMAADTVGQAKCMAQQQARDTKEKSQDVLSQAAGKTDDVKNKANEQLRSVTNTAGGAEAKAKEPAQTRSQANTEEAAKATAGTARKEARGKNSK